MNRLPLMIAILFPLMSACSLIGDDGKAPGAPGGAGSSAGAGKGGGGGPPAVVIGKVEERTLVDSIEAVGNARANEQADLNSTVTERIDRINFGDGQFVPRGAVIAELVSSEQRATLAESRARQREAELQMQRLKQLQAQGFASRARIDEQQAAVDVARAQAAQASAQIAERVIRAPFAGWLSLRKLSAGTVVTAGTTVATIVDYSRIKLDFTVPETFLPVLQPGLDVVASVAAFPGESFRGQIASVDPQIDPVTRAATARAILANPDRRLRPGMLMTVAIKAPPRSALTVPELAVIGEGGGAYVWRVGADNMAARVNVRTGARREGRVEILAGLAEGDRVVAEGTVKLRGPGPVRAADVPPERQAAA